MDKKQDAGDLAMQNDGMEDAGRAGSSFGGRRPCIRDTLDWFLACSYQSQSKASLSLGCRMPALLPRAVITGKLTLAKLTCSGVKGGQRQIQKASAVHIEATALSESS